MMPPPTTEPTPPTTMRQAPDAVVTERTAQAGPCAEKTMSYRREGCRRVAALGRCVARVRGTWRCARQPDAVSVH